MNTPVVSIIIPTQNRPQFLKEAVESVFTQTFPDWEMIIVNDGSTDGTKELIEEYAHRDSRIRAIHLPQKTGISHARNQAMRLIRSRYIAFLDDDDVWLPEKLRKQISSLEDQKDVGLLFSQVYMTDSALSRQGIFPLEWQATYEGLLERNYWIPLSSVMVRSACLDRVGVFDEKLARSADYDLWLRVARLFPFEGLREPLVLYRQHPQNMSSEPSGRYRAHLVTYQKLLKFPDSRPFVRLIQSRLAREYYELGRIHQGKGEHLEAVRFFTLSVVACPWIGWQLRSYQPHHSPFFSLVKPYLAIVYCLWRGLLPEGCKKEVAA